MRIGARVTFWQKRVLKGSFFAAQTADPPARARDSGLGKSLNIGVKSNMSIIQIDKNLLLKVEIQRAFAEPQSKSAWKHVSIVLRS